MVRVLRQDFQRDGALSGDDVRVVKRVYVGVAVRFLQFARVLRGGVVEVAMQDDFHLRAAQTAHRVNFDLRRGDRHDDDRAHSEAVGRERHTLRVVARRRANHPARAFFGAQAVHLGIGAAQFEGKHRLQVFALAENIVSDPVGEARHRVQRRLRRHVINRSGKNFLDIMLHA